MLGMGMTLGPQDFSKIYKSPQIIALGVTLQFLIMPAWAALLVWFLQLPKEFAVGLILVACCPGGTASNVVVFLARPGCPFRMFDSLFHFDCGGTDALVD